jgi:hypothetical protein
MEDRGRHARAQTAAADGHENRPHSRQIFQDLPPHGSLPRDDQGIVVRGNQCRSLGLHDLERAVHAILRRGPRELDAGAQPLRAAALRGRDGRRHDHGRRRAEQPGGQGDRLRVIAR